VRNWTVSGGHDPLSAASRLSLKQSRYQWTALWRRGRMKSAKPKCAGKSCLSCAQVDNLLGGAASFSAGAGRELPFEIFKLIARWELKRTPTGSGSRGDGRSGWANRAHLAERGTLLARWTPVSIRCPRSISPSGEGTILDRRMYRKQAKRERVAFQQHSLVFIH